MTLSETVGEGIIFVAICGGSFHSLPGLVGHYRGGHLRKKIIIEYVYY